MVNHREISERIEAVGIDVLGREHVTAIPKGLGAEDFGYFAEFAPGAMFTPGTLIEGDERYLHHPRLDVDERALPIGAAMLAETALRLLREHEDEASWVATSSDLGPCVVQILAQNLDRKFQWQAQKK